LKSELMLEGLIPTEDARPADGPTQQRAGGFGKISAATNHKSEKGTASYALLYLAGF
jgi:hypothetical protein